MRNAPNSKHRSTAKAIWDAVNATLAFLALAGSVLAAMIVVIWQVGQQVFGGPVIDPISVPETLAKAGYTPDVVALMIADGVDSSIAQAAPKFINGGILPGEFALQTRISVAPTDAVSQAISSALQYFGLRGRVHYSGEIIGADSSYWLKLRRNGQELADWKVRPEQSALDATGPSEFMKSVLRFGLSQTTATLRTQAAYIVLRDERPVVLAAVFDLTDHKRAIDEASRIFAHLPKNDPNVLYAHNLMGFVYAAEVGDLQLAKNEMDTAITLYPKWADAYHNRGNVHLELYRNAFDEYRKNFDEKRYNEAVSEMRLAAADYERAIKLNHMLAAPHNALGNIFLDEVTLASRPQAGATKARHYFRSAQAEYRSALAINRKYVIAHEGLGALFLNEGECTEAHREFDAVIRLNQKDAKAKYYFDRIAQRDLPASKQNQQGVSNSTSAVKGQKWSCGIRIDDF